MAKLAVEKLPDYKDQDVVPGHVRAEQLEIVRDLYLGFVPDGEGVFQEEYKENLDEFINILKKGRHDAKKSI